MLTPILGISTNPIKNVPTILPIVDNDDILPDNEPISCSSILFIFTAYGEIIANIKLGIENTIIAHIIAAIIKLGIKPANIFTTQVSNNGIALVANAEYNKILANLFILASLSAFFPPIQYPKLILTKIIPIILVHTTFELPTYGDNTLAAISSNPIPIAPPKNTIVSNLYFFMHSPFHFLHYNTFILFLHTFLNFKRKRLRKE